MFSLDEPNIHNIAIEGVFDDCQNLVKELAGDLGVKRELHLGAVNSINLNTVSGNSTIRLEETLPANYVLRSMSGAMLVDGVDRGNSGPTNFTGSTGELAGSFVDIRTNSVSGDTTVLRQPLTTVADDEEWDS